MTRLTAETWTERYALAQSILLAPDAVVNGAVYPRWVDAGRFWYDRKGEAGTEYRLVEAATGEGRVILTQAAVAKVLAERLEADVDAEVLILYDLAFDLDADQASFSAFGQPYVYGLKDGVLAEGTKTADRGWLVSPDGKTAAFTREDNVWVRDIETGAERALTTDGTEHYSYATTPVSMRGMRAKMGGGLEALWSPDGTRLFTLQTDDRHVPDLSVTEFAPVDGIRPRVTTNKTSLPADPKVTEFRIISIEVETGRQTEARYARLTAVRMNDTPFSAGSAWWSDDGKTAYFVDVERGEQAAHLVAFDVETGATRVVFSEIASTYVELSVNVYAPALIYPIPGTNELVWYSERSGHGHLYLYDLTTGAPKGVITSGPWQVRDVQHVDPVRREVFFTAAGIAPDEDPYTCKPCIASLDGGAVRVLSDEPGDHIVWRGGEFGLLMLSMLGVDRFAVSGLSSDGEHFVETIGAADSLPRTVLRRRSGEEVAVIETAEDRGLPAGWTWPEPVKLKAADGVTDTYGLLFKPAGYDPAKTYPIIDYIYGGPQVSNVPKKVFAGGSTEPGYFEAAHMAALGAFVLILDGRGTAERERGFRDASWGAIHDASHIDDHIAGIRQLAESRPIDLDRVGIFGFSGGGYATALAALRNGDFFKVAVAGGGNYDQALFWHSWGERYHGRFDADFYAIQAAKTYAEGLQGKLLLVHGLMDSGCHPAALFQLVQALIEQNKDADLVILPRAGHEMTAYGVRRRLDYFVTHLFGEAPPSGVKLTIGSDRMVERIVANAAPPAKRA
jgi:dipeptidyl-peptidase-4